MPVTLKEDSVVLFRKLQLFYQKVVLPHSKIYSSFVHSCSDLGIWSDDHIPGLKRVANVIHAHGSKAGIQVILIIHFY